jgi:LysR family transcriptional regulator (chromosome initiation inhibitor)
MLDYFALKVLQTVVQSGSFERAAAILNVTPSAVSQRIKHLEERLGTTLVVRGSPCQATEKGLLLCRHMEQVGILESDLLKSLPSLALGEQVQQRVTLHIATNADSLATWFLAAAGEFTQSSDYLIRFALDDQDSTAEWLKQGKVVAAVTSAGKPVPGCRQFSLGALRYHATASPSFVARYFSNGVTAHALAKAPSLTFNQKDRLQLNWINQILGVNINVPEHWLPSTHGFVEASVTGMGWGMNPIHLAKEHIEAGRLVDLVPGQNLDIPLFWQVNRLAADGLSSLTKTIVEAAKRSLVQN